MNFKVSINYEINTPTKANTWDGEAHPISIFGHMEFLEIDSKKILISLLQIADYIRVRKVKQGKILDITELQGFGKAEWNFISSIYEAGWDFISINKQNVSFRNSVSNKLNTKSSKFNNSSYSDRSKEKTVEIVKLSPSIPVCLPKEVLEESKFFRKDKKSKIVINTNAKKLYAQTTSLNILNILKLKENYPSLLEKMIEDIHRIINNTDKTKPCIKMTTKGSLQKQIIVLMSKTNVDNIMASLADHVTNINRALKTIKSKVMVDYIHLETMRVTIVSNAVASQSNLQVMERYIKNIENIMSDDVQVPRLPQSKSFSKIIEISYFVKDTNSPITSDNIKLIIKANHIFNDLTLMSKPGIIKASPKSDIAVIWIDVWNTQSDKNRKMIINRCFNVRKHIATIYRASINPGVP